MRRFFWVNIHYATFGIESKEGVVVTTAPIASWMKGKTLEGIRPWLIEKKAKVIELKF